MSVGSKYFWVFTLPSAAFFPFKLLVADPAPDVKGYWRSAVITKDFNNL